MPVDRVARALARRIDLGSERGSFLVEVLVGAVVLAIATFAVLDGLSGAHDTGERNRQRSTAATLVQQDIERLRAFRVTDLSNYRETRTVSSGGVAYTVVSRTDWVRDASGTVSCTNDDSQVEYLKITSTAWSPASKERPVREVSLLTPPPGAFSATAGTAAVKLTDRDGLPHSGETVTLSGPSTHTDSTNAEGCAIFGMIPAGSYEVEVPGMVGWGGAGGNTNQVTVVPAKTSLKQLEVEPPASLRARFQAPDGSPATWNTITVANAKLPGGTRAYTEASPQPSIDATGLFPFLDGYGVYAGTCRASNPAVWQPDYYSSSGKGFVLLDPGDLLEAVDVQLAHLRVNVRNSSGNPVTARVTLRQTDTGTGCNTSAIVALGIGGSTYDFHVPFGNYRICANSGSGSSVRRRESTGPVAAGTETAPRDKGLRPGSGAGVGIDQTMTVRLPSNTGGGAC